MIWFALVAVASLTVLVGHGFLAVAIKHQPPHLNWFSRSSVLWAPAISLILGTGTVGILGRFIGDVLSHFRIDRLEPDIAVGIAAVFCCGGALLWGSRRAMRVKRTRLLNLGDLLSLGGLGIGIWALMEIASDADCVGYQAADLACPY